MDHDSCLCTIRSSFIGACYEDEANFASYQSVKRAYE